MHLFQFLTAFATLWCVLCRDALLKKSVSKIIFQITPQSYKTY